MVISHSKIDIIFYGKLRYLSKDIFLFILSDIEIIAWSYKPLPILGLSSIKGISNFLSNWASPRPEIYSIYGEL